MAKTESVSTAESAVASTSNSQGLRGLSIRTLRRFYAFQLLSEARFDSAVWIIYLQSRGYSLGQIGLAEAAYHLAPVLLEIPSGSFADLIGRRWSLATGAALVAVAGLLLWYAPSLPVVMLSLFLSGAAASFRSGADQAYLFDAIGMGEGEHVRFADVLGKILGAAYVVGAAATWLGAAVSERSYGLTFGLIVAAGLAGVWLAAGLAEPPRERRAGEDHSIRRHAAEARRVLEARPTVAAMLLISGVFWAASTIAHLYLQAAFAARGLSNNAIGIIAAATLLLNAGGAVAAGRAAGRGRFGPQFVILALVTRIGLALTGATSLLLAIGAYLGAQIASGLIEPLLATWFNRHVPSGQRATILSVESWLFSLTMIGTFPAAGVFAERLGWGPLYVVCGGVTIALGLGVLLALRRRGMRAVTT